MARDAAVGTAQRASDSLPRLAGALTATQSWIQLKPLRRKGFAGANTALRPPNRTPHLA